MTNEDMRDCGNCKHYVIHDNTANWAPVYASCEKWKCEFEPKDVTTDDTLPDRIKLAESWIIRFQDSDLEDPDDYDLYNNALSIIIEAIESGRYHLTRR